MGEKIYLIHLNEFHLKQLSREARLFGSLRTHHANHQTLAIKRFRKDPQAIPTLDMNSMRTYEIKPGDTLSEIASRYGVSIQALQEQNGIQNPNLIQAGQSIVIPAPSVFEK